MNEEAPSSVGASINESFESRRIDDVPQNPLNQEVNVDENQQSETQRIVFRPDEVFYDSLSGKYYVGFNQRYRAYGNKEPVLIGLTRYFEDQENLNPEAAAKQTLSSVVIDRAIDWAGDIAGQQRGVLNRPNAQILVTSSPVIPEPCPGDWPTIRGILDQLFGSEEDQLNVVIGWIKGAYKAVAAHQHHPAPILAVAGPPKCGKSLLSWIIAQLLGGRIGHPYASWAGITQWNDDLVANELLLVDDSVGSTDYRKRQAFATRFKESIFGSEVHLRKRNSTAISVRPVWRAMMCCNDNPESLAVLPAIDEDMVDKIILVRANPVVPPVDTSTPEGREQLMNMIRLELPGFCFFLVNSFGVPEHLSDSRSGVCAWKHPDLVDALGSMTPWEQLRELIQLAYTHGDLNLEPGESLELTSSRLASALTSPGSSTAIQARSLLRSARQVGRYLGKLAEMNDGLVEKSTVRNGFQHWKIHRPDNSPSSEEHTDDPF